MSAVSKPLSIPYYDRDELCNFLMSPSPSLRPVLGTPISPVRIHSNGFRPYLVSLSSLVVYDADAVCFAFIMIYVSYLHRPRPLLLSLMSTG